jgi:hypothetical protein
MDFEDYALAGLGTAGGLALGGKVVGQNLGKKWGEDAYYKSKVSSLGTAAVEELWGWFTGLVMTLNVVIRR